MLTKEYLSEDNKNVIKSEIKQILLTYSLIGIILSVLIISLNIGLNDGIDFSYEKGNILFWNISLSAIGIFFFAMFLSCRTRLLDIYFNKKNVVTTKVISKEIETRYPSMPNVKEALKHLPPAYVYYLIVEKERLGVTKEAYDCFKEGEIIKLSHTIYSKKLIQIESNE